jgi:hypothetical protein
MSYIYLAGDCRASMGAELLHSQVPSSGISSYCPLLESVMYCLSGRQNSYLKSSATLTYQ